MSDKPRTIRVESGEDVEVSQEIADYVTLLQSLVVIGCNTCEWIGPLVATNVDPIEYPIRCPKCKGDVGHVSVNVVKEMIEGIKSKNGEIDRLRLELSMKQREGT